MEMKVASPDGMETQFFSVNGLKKRTKETVQIPVNIKQIKDKNNLLKSYDGPLETVIRYHEFFDKGGNFKSELMNFQYLA